MILSSLQLITKKITLYYIRSINWINNFSGKSTARSAAMNQRRSVMTSLRKRASVSVLEPTTASSVPLHQPSLQHLNHQ